jgi:formylglycine-generating enzyme required for sulfatase activity
MALAELGEPDTEFLLDSIATAPDDELHLLATALERIGGSIHEQLWQRFRESGSRTARVRLAATLLHLGSPKAAEDLAAAEDGDPSDRTKFISSFRPWRADSGQVAKILGNSGSAELRAMLCLALAEIPLEEVLSDHQPALQVALLHLYQKDPDRCVHSAAGLVLRRWWPEAALPSVQAPPGVERSWFVNSQGMTMLYIPPGTFTMGAAGIGEVKRNQAELHVVELTRPFYMCDRETWVDLFKRYWSDLDCPPELKPKGPRPDPGVSPTGEHPVQMVTWGDAVRFCNWLSWKEGRTPCYTNFRIEQKVYVPESNERPNADHWDCDFTANGYRLPTEAEWEYACRAGTTTGYSFGDDEKELARYCVFDGWLAAPVATKLPNPWGLFDMHGNIREWCWDFWSANYPKGRVTDPTGPTGRSAVHMQRGGSWYDYGRTCRSAERQANYYRPFVDKVSGIRVVCTAFPPDAAGKPTVPEKPPTDSQKP